MAAFGKYALTAVSLIWLAAPALAAEHKPDAVAVLAASKKAMGGSAWDRVKGSYEEGARGGTPYKTWLDFGSYGMKTETGTGPAAQSQGYDGVRVWQHSAAGTRTSQDPAALAEIRTTAYLSNNGFFFTKRFKAQVSYVRLASEGTARFDVIETTPEGGRALELWFDHSSHFLTRVVDRGGESTITVLASDFRKVGKVTIAFRLTVRNAKDETLDEGQVKLIELRAIPRSTFAPASGG